MSDEPSPERTCPKCGTPLAADTSEGLCPACLMALNLATQTQMPEEVGPNGTKKVPSPPESPPTPEEIANHFPQFEILECLGRGGMGVVYKARQRSLDRLVALKILAPEREKDPQFAERFAREAKTLAQLNHPSIVTVHDFGEAGGMFYLVMEFVDGVNLRHLLKERKLSPEEALAVVPPVCEALQYAHKQGVIHRDIKPENLLLDKQGRIKIADFGIAKILGRAGTTSGQRQSAAPEGMEGTAPSVPTSDRPALTQDQVFGTPQYMAPEQTDAPQKVDHRADIYSLGVVLYEMLTGELPATKLQPPSKKVRVDVRIDEIVLRALEKEPERRYQTATQFRTMVETIAAEAAKSEVRSQNAEGKQDRPVPVGKYNPWETTIIGVGTMFFVVLFSVAWAWSGPFRVPLIVMCVLGLGICALSLAGLWPFPSPFFPEPNFSARNLKRRKRSAAPPQAAVAPAPGGRARGCFFVAGTAVLVGVGLLLLLTIGSIAVSLALPALHRAKSHATAKYSDMAEMDRDAGPLAVTVPESGRSFGAVMERVLSGKGDQNPRFIDFDTGRLIAASEFFDSKDEPSPEETRRWWRETGVDAMADTGPAVRGMLGLEMVAVPVSTEEWERAAPARLNYYLEMAEPGTPTTLAGKGELPVTFAIKTREGTQGLLQITGVTDRPSRVSIRYKLVTSEASIHSSSQATRDFVVFHPATNGTAVLDAARDFVMDHNWRLLSEGGGNERVTIQALDANAKRVAFEEVLQTGGMARFTVHTESGAQIPARRIGSELWRQLSWGRVTSARAFSAGESTMADAASPDRELLRVKLRAAQAALTDLEARFKAGQVSPVELEQARIEVDVLEAQLDGDLTQVAAVRLEGAQRLLELTSQRFEAGLIPRSELIAAQAEVELRELEAQALEASPSAAVDVPLTARVQLMESDPHRSHWRWRIHREPGTRMVYGVLDVTDSDHPKQVLMGRENLPLTIQSSQDYALRLTAEADNWRVDVETAWAGESGGRGANWDELEAPANAVLRVVHAEPFGELNTERYHVFWQGELLVRGRVLKRLYFAARLAEADDPVQNILGPNDTARSFNTTATHEPANAVSISTHRARLTWILMPALLLGLLVLAVSLGGAVWWIAAGAKTGTAAGRGALVLALGGLPFALVAAVALSFVGVVGTFAGSVAFLAMEIPAFCLGLLSRQTGLGKAAMIISATLLLISLLFLV